MTDRMQLRQPKGRTSLYQAASELRKIFFQHYFRKWAIYEEAFRYLLLVNGENKLDDFNQNLYYTL